MQIESFGQTHVGKVRQNNEDAFIVSDKLKLYAVADGIGSLSHGELASKLAVNLLKMAAEGISTIGMPLNFSMILKSLNESIIDAGHVLDPLDGIGTTLTAFQLIENNANFVQTGDSCAFYFLNGEGKKISTDHTVAQYKLSHPEQYTLDSIEEEDNHTLTSCLGVEIMYGPEFYSQHIEPGSTVILCSDGASNLVTVSEMNDIVRIGQSAKYIVEKIISVALSRGANDNVTAVCIKFL
jgi:protein phosphatase